MSYNKKGHYGRYSGNAHHSKHHMVNTWEEEDVKRGIEEEHKGHSGHAEALFDDAHDSYNWHPGMDTHAEHGPSRYPSTTSVWEVGRRIEDARKQLRDEYTDLQGREALKHPNPYYPPALEVSKRIDEIWDHPLDPFGEQALTARRAKEKLQSKIVSGPSRHTSGHLDAYEGVDSKSLHPYDDGAGGIDYEAMARDRAKAKEALTEAAQSHIDSLHPKKKMMMTKNIKPKKMMMTKDIKPIKK